MRTGFRLAALGVIVITLALWFFGGPNLGWTKTQVAVPVKDEVTGIEGVEWQKHFVPGLDFVAGGVVVAGTIWGMSFAFRRKV